MSGRKGVKPGTISARVLALISQGTKPLDELCADVYGHAPDAPDDEHAALRRTIDNLRRKGYEIEYIAAYRLKP